MGWLTLSSGRRPASNADNDDDDGDNGVFRGVARKRARLDNQNLTTAPAGRDGEEELHNGQTQRRTRPALEFGRRILSATMAPPTDTTASGTDPESKSGPLPTPLDSPDETEFQTVEQLKELPLMEGDTWYLISITWFTSWKAWCQHRVRHPGPIDNSDVLDARGMFKKSMVCGWQYDIVPQKGWDLLVKVYGIKPGQSPIARKVTLTPAPKLEVYLQAVKVRPVGKDCEKYATTTLQVSKQATMKEFRGLALQAIGLPNDTECKLWSFYMGNLCPLDDLRSKVQIALLPNQTVVVELKNAAGAFVIKPNDTGDMHVPPEPVSKPPSAAAATATTTVTSDTTDTTNGANGATNGATSTDTTAQGAAASATASASASASSAAAASSSPGTNTNTYVSSYNSGNSYGGNSYGSSSYSSSYSSNNYRSSYSASSRTAEPGVVGLMNLGNTCFMNSAIQCLSNCGPLRDYFLTGRYKDDENPSNPIGHGCDISSEFAALITKLWRGREATLAPRDLKTVVGKHRSQFSGYAQHDAQELVAFLLDGLHEDLNRIRKKPFVEKKEAEDDDIAAFAQEAWNDHLKRNDSVIVDLFHGQYKSTVECPDCGKVSVTLDPFGQLTVPLPNNNLSAGEVEIQLRNEEQPIKVGVLVPTPAPVGVVKEAAAKALGVPASNFVAVDVRNRSIQRHLDDTERWDVKRTYYSSMLLCEVPPQAAGDEPLALVSIDHFGTSTYISTGRPLVLAVPKDATYAQLYDAIETRMAPVLKESVALQTSGNDSHDELDEQDEQLEQQFQLNHAAGSAKVADQPVASRPAADRLFQLKELSRSGSPSSPLPDDNAPLTSVLANTAGGLCHLAAVWKSRTTHVDTMKEMQTTEHESVKSCKQSLTTAATLDKCIRLSLERETLTEDNQWRCPECKEDRQAFKQLAIWKLPRILVVHLKRFKYSRWSRDKIESVVDFPLEGLDMSPYLTGPTPAQPPIYDLFAVSNHFGGLGGGHYTAHAKNPDSQKWYDFDDSRVSSARASDAKSRSSYLLFYQLRGDNTEDVSAAEVKTEAPASAAAASAASASSTEPMQDVEPSR